MAARDEGQLNVLVIDDDDALRQFLVEIVTQKGHQVVAAPSAEEGLKHLPVWTFQVALLDQNLPGLEGLVLGEYLRRNNPDMTIALVTGEDDPRLEKRTRDLAITFVPKPFRPQDIWHVLDEYSAGAEERDERRRRREDADYEPPIARYSEDLLGAFDVPGVPARIADKIVSVVKRALNDLRAVRRYNERDRVVALSGLLTARVLGLELPLASNGRTLFDEYDDIMRARGRRPEFTNSRSRPPPPPRTT